MTLRAELTSSTNEIHTWLVEWFDEGFRRVWQSDEPWLTQALVAQRAGMSAKHLSEMLNGWQHGSFDAWVRLLATLGVLDEALASRPSGDTADES